MTMAEGKKIKTALVSVYHKDGLEELLAKLSAEGVAFLSTGGTQAFIEQLGYDCQKVEDVTSYPSILGGRVKTLHPKVFGGILARRDNEGDRGQMAQYEIPEIDLVVVDLYPFEQTVADGASEEDIIEKIDGQRILRNSDYTSLMDGRAGKDLRVSVFNPKTNKHFDVQVRPISRNAQRELLYKRWVDHNRDLVDSLSHGQLAYVHVKAMDSESFRTVFSELLSDKNHNRKAAIIDERHNGGGWLHDDLCTLLSGKEYQEFIAHGKYVGRDPWNKWVKPSCVMICEDDYSNGHGFPFVYKTLGIGKLVGTPVAGTMTAVWWETQMDRSLVFGIPQVGCRDMNGQYGENHQLDPDVEVYNTPEDYLKGDDEQLKKAVETMLK